MAVTRKDVAEKAGVSTATVSHVINETKYVSDELKARVKKAIDKLDYKPNKVAKSLSTRESKQVAIAVNDITNPYYNEIVLGFEEEAKRMGYIVNVCTGNNSLTEYYEDFYSRHIDGIYLLVNYNKIERKKISKILKNGTVLVTGFPHNPFDGKSSVIRVDYLDGMKQIFKHLIKLGHKKIGYIDFTEPKIEENAVRFKSYKSCLNEFSLSYDEDYIIFGNPPYNSSYDEGYRYMKKLIERETDITAVIVINDYMAVGALDALKEYQIRVPEDMSIVSIDNTIFSRTANPKLTTLHVDKKNKGVRAMQLIEKMNKKDVNNLEIILSPNLIIRESSAPVDYKGGGKKITE